MLKILQRREHAHNLGFGNALTPQAERCNGMSDSIVAALEVGGDDNAGAFKLLKQIKRKDFVENMVYGAEAFSAAILFRSDALLKEFGIGHSLPGHMCVQEIKVGFQEYYCTKGVDQKLIFLFRKNTVHSVLPGMKDVAQPQGYGNESGFHFRELGIFRDGFAATKVQCIAAGQSLFFDLISTCLILCGGDSNGKSTLKGINLLQMPQ
jgi:hypothetical protein